MRPTDDLVFIHKWVPAESGSPDPVTLLLLHGTGGDKNALLPVGNELWPAAALLGLRGTVLENGMPSSFRWFTEAGIEDIKPKTEELPSPFKSGSADVTVSWHQGGRELGEDDIQAVK